MVKCFSNYRMYVVVVAILLIAWGSPLLSTDTQAAPSEDWSTAIERVAQQTIPAVAHIEITQRQEVANPLLPFEDDPACD